MGNSWDNQQRIHNLCGLGGSKMVWDLTDDTLFVVILIVGIILAISLVVFIGYQSHMRGCDAACLESLENMREFVRVVNPSA